MPHAVPTIMNWTPPSDDLQDIEMQDKLNY